MITHIVMWTLKDEAAGGTATENADKMLEMLRNLDGKIAELKSISVSKTFLDTTTEEIQVILVSTHDDAEGLKAYAVHPEHVKCGEFIKQVAASRKAVDFVA